MKTILLWDQRFRDRKAMRLTVDDGIASAMVRSGVASAADPSQSSSIAAGVPLSGDYPVRIALTHGVNAQSVVQVTVPLSVALVAEAAGLASRIPFVPISLPNAIITDDTGDFILSDLDGAQITGD